MPRRPLAFVSCALVQSSTTPQSATYLAMPRSRNDIAAEIPRAANAPPRSIEKKEIDRQRQHAREWVRVGGPFPCSRAAHDLDRAVDVLSLEARIGDR